MYTICHYYCLLACRCFLAYATAHHLVKLTMNVSTIYIGTPRNESENHSIFFYINCDFKSRNEVSIEMYLHNK